MELAMVVLGRMDLNRFGLQTAARAVDIIHYYLSHQRSCQG